MSLLDKIVRRSLDNERSLVDDPPHARRLVTREVVLFVVVMACLVGRDWLQDVSVVAYLVSGVIVGMCCGMGALAGIRRAQSYRSGWLAGRTTMITSMLEAQRRGMSITEWLDGEFARDAHVLGLHVHRDEPPPPPDGSHDDL